MHASTSTISAFISIFLLMPSAALTMYLLPPEPVLSKASAPMLRRNTIESSCTFTLFHRQQLASTFPSWTHSAQKTNYIQLHTIYDHANELTIDVAHALPREAFQSFVHLSSTRDFAVQGLLDDKRLTVSARDGEDEVRFSVSKEEEGEQKFLWKSEESVARKSAEAWCEVGEWDERVCSRVRRMECAFPCEKIIDGDEDEREREELK